MPLTFVRKKALYEVEQTNRKETSNKVTVDSESEEDYFDVSSDEEL